MSGILRVKLALLVIGGILLAYGIKSDDETLRLVAIGLFAVAFFLRFLDRRSENAKPPSDG